MTQPPNLVPVTRRTISRGDYDRLMPMVRRIAMRLARRLPDHITVGDLTSAGWVGLLEACSRSDSGMPEEEFAAYASHRVRGAMLDYLRQLDPATRQARNTSRRIAKTIRNITQQIGRPPEEEEIAAGLGLDLDQYRELLNSISSAGMTRVDMVNFERIEGDPSWLDAPDEATDKRMLKDRVARAITKLPERLQLVLALYYQEGCTLREIGTLLEVSESRVCQLHTEAVHRLRARLGRA